MKVSVITPSKNPEMLPRLIELFLAQDYADKELNILSDGAGFTLYTSPDKQIWHWGADHLNVGQKRNELVKFAKGDIILHMDDDDFYAPDWISRSVKHLLATNADTTGLRSGWFYKPHTALWGYDYSNNGQRYVLGATMCYRRKVWENRAFKPMPQGEDAVFVANGGVVMPHDYKNGFMAMIHGNNTCSHQMTRQMKAYQPDYAKYVLGNWYEKY